jgi:hypothetical protein
LSPLSSFSHFPATAASPLPLLLLLLLPLMLQCFQTFKRLRQTVKSVPGENSK